MKTDTKLIRTIDAARHITRVFHRTCTYCKGTGGPDDCVEWVRVDYNKSEKRPTPHNPCCSCKGKGYWEHREKAQKFLCVGGPLEGQWHIADWGQKKNPTKDYVLFNRSSRWQGGGDVPSAVLVWGRKVRMVKAA